MTNKNAFNTIKLDGDAMKKGFTLIELLAVIIILSLLATVTLYATGNIIKDSKKNLSETQKNKLYEAAKMLYMEHSSSISEESAICVSTLVKLGYIESERVIDPATNRPLDGYILISNTGNSIKYEYMADDVEYCGTEGTINGTEGTINGGEVIITRWKRDLH